MSEGSYAERFLAEAAEIARSLPTDAIDRMATGIAAVRERGGRLFILGIGGGAGHASHAVNDFRKLCHIECYTPTDNVSELTARTNDEGWETTFTEWLTTSRLGDKDALLVFSVGGGSLDPPISVNLAKAVERAHEVGADVFGIVGRAEGTTARLATECVVVAAPPARMTPHVEAFQAVVWHLLVSHPSLAAQDGKWETTNAQNAQNAQSAQR
jgi:D-sedoheptulose 7-phosphate isomerase